MHPQWWWWFLGEFSWSLECLWVFLVSWGILWVFHFFLEVSNPFREVQDLSHKMIDWLYVLPVSVRLSACAVCCSVGASSVTFSLSSYTSYSAL